MAGLLAAGGTDFWRWVPHPEVWVLVGNLVGLYAYAARVIGPKAVPALAGLLALQVLSVVIGAIGKAVSSPAYPVDIDAGFSINGWLAVLLTFLLVGFALIAMHLTHRNLVGLVARGARQQGRDDPLGPDRARTAGARLDPAIRGPRLRPALARILDLAPLHPPDRPRRAPNPLVRGLAAHLVGIVAAGAQHVAHFGQRGLPVRNVLEDLGAAPGPGDGSTGGRAVRLACRAEWIHHGPASSECETRGGRATVAYFQPAYAMLVPRTGWSELCSEVTPTDTLSGHIG